MTEAPTTLTHRRKRASERWHRGLWALALFAAACSPQPSSMASSASGSSSGTSSAVPAPAPTRSGELWGDLKPVVSVKELMKDMLDPAADNIFDAVNVVSTRQGTVERTPKTEEDWEKIRIGAVTIAEGVYLLKIPRPFAPDGDLNNSTGPDATELSPSQIKAKIEADTVLWNAKIEALRNVGLEVIEIANKKKVDELWDAGDNLDRACEGCHVEYWYPGDKAALEKLDRQIEEQYQKSRGEKKR
ncbi:MAG TPA: hypothetical protein VNZ26_26985 [Vicinamibacterales bacterium]|jgi:hypothetical protein|nr:hypothetical protein [Vicinamibacterales bacterium]